MGASGDRPDSDSGMGAASEDRDMELSADWSNEVKPAVGWNEPIDDCTPDGRNELGCSEDRLDGPKEAEPSADEGKRPTVGVTRPAAE